MFSKYIINCLYNNNYSRKEGLIGGSDNMRSIDGKNVVVLYVCRHNVNGMVDFRLFNKSRNNLDAINKTIKV